MRESALSGSDSARAKRVQPAGTAVSAVSGAMSGAKTGTSGLGQSKSIGGGIKRVQTQAPKDTKLKPDEFRKKLQQMEQQKDDGKKEEKGSQQQEEMPPILGMD